MNNPIKTTPEELEELLKLVHKHNGFIFSDLRIAEQIQRIAKSKGYCVTSDVALTAAYNRQGVIFRIGYILGQRHERAKRAARNNAAFEKGIKISAALFESVSEGGDLAKIAAAIKQKRSAETTHTHTRRAEIRVLHRLERRAAA